MTSHADERAKERFGVGLNRQDFAEMVRQIEGGEVNVTTSGCGPYRVSAVVAIKGVRMRAIFDTRTRRIVTVYPPRHGKDRPKRKVWRDGRRYERG